MASSPKDVIAGVQRTNMLDQEVEFPELALVHPLREARLGEGAGRAEPKMVAVIGDSASVGKRKYRLAHSRRRRATRSRART